MTVKQIQGPKQTNYNESDDTVYPDYGEHPVVSPGWWCPHRQARDGHERLPRRTQSSQKHHAVEDGVVALADARVQPRAVVIETPHVLVADLAKSI
mmetsp:Transcript_46787/g.69214  ORF Transcript_46787/g.69214 Transcript_46787/m.69214 type:complete len:96 (-) Transcript_46787:404-691(-)